MQEINYNPYLYTTQESMGEIENNPQVYTMREGIGEINNESSVIHYPRGYRRDKK